MAAMRHQDSACVVEALWVEEQMVEVFVVAVHGGME